MNLLSFRTFLVFVCSIGLISYVVAGPGNSGDHGRGQGSGASNGNGPGTNQDNNPGQEGQSASDGTQFNSQDNPGKSGSAWGRDKAEDASSKRVLAVWEICRDEQQNALLSPLCGYNRLIHETRGRIFDSCVRHWV